VCVFSHRREAPGKTYVEKCLFFIRQMETDRMGEQAKLLVQREEEGEMERV